MEREFELMRAKLWCETVVAVAGASNTTYSHTCTKWADKIVKAFEDKFKPITEGDSDE